MIPYSSTFKLYNLLFKSLIEINIFATVFLCTRLLLRRSVAHHSREVHENTFGCPTRRGPSRVRVDARGVRALLRTRGPGHRRAAQHEGDHLPDFATPCAYTRADPFIHRELHLHYDMECHRLTNNSILYCIVFVHCSI